MIVTDEMVRRALDVLASKVGGCPGLTLSDVCDDTQCGCADETRAAIEAVAPMIRAAALDEAIETVAKREALWRERGGRLMSDATPWDDAIDAIRALKTRRSRYDHA